MEWANRTKKHKVTVYVTDEEYEMVQYLKRRDVAFSRLLRDHIRQLFYKVQRDEEVDY